jgi:hypothetical protein
MVNMSHSSLSLNLRSHEAVLDFLRDQGYQVEFTPWDISDLPDRARELIGSGAFTSWGRLLTGTVNRSFR